MLSRHLEVSLRLAVSMARQKRHEFLTVEHLLLALLDNDSAVFDSSTEAYTLSIDSYEDLPALEADWLQAKQAHPQNSFRVVVMSVLGLLPILLFILWLFFRK